MLRRKDIRFEAKGRQISRKTVDIKTEYESTGTTSRYGLFARVYEISQSLDGLSGRSAPSTLVRRFRAKC